MPDLNRIFRLLHAAFILLMVQALALPAAAQVKLYGNLVNRIEVEPGQTYSGELGVMNEGERTAQVRVFQADFQYGAERTTYVDPGTLGRSNSRWIAFSPEFVEVQPETMERIDYTITVPEDSAALEGSYWSVLTVEVISPDDAEWQGDGEPEEAVSASFVHRIRYAVQLVTTVAGTGEEELEVVSTQLLEEAPETAASPDGPAAQREGAATRWLQADLKNVGTASYRPAVYVELYDGSGALASRIDGLTHLMHPGSVVRQQIDLSDVPSGTYQALLVIETDENVFGTQLELEL